MTSDKKLKTTSRFSVPGTSGWNFIVPDPENIYENTVRIWLLDITRHPRLCHNRQQNLGKIIPTSLTSRSWETCPITLSYVITMPNISAPHPERFDANIVSRHSRSLYLMSSPSRTSRHHPPEQLDVQILCRHDGSLCLMSSP